MSVSFNLKFYVGEEIYCTEINVDTSEEFTFNKLLDVLHGLAPIEQFVGLKWIDAENELICLRNDADLLAALRNLHPVAGKGVLRIRLPQTAPAVCSKRKRSPSPTAASSRAVDERTLGSPAEPPPVNLAVPQRNEQERLARHNPVFNYEYLHTNSTTHQFLFGALAELVDNSRDAGATTMDIYTVPMSRFRGGHLLCFLDDGCGMSRQESEGIVRFGYSKKRLDHTMVGLYGNGLKSGALRIGQDFILFTKKDRVLSCVFLSRTFQESEKIDEVIVPMPHFCGYTRKSLACSYEERQRHDTEMRLILRYSPFKTMDEFLAQFDKIKGESGTLVIIYNLKLLDNGEPELDFKSDATDIKLADAEGSNVDVVPERCSLRAYLAVLYEAPRMKIYCQHKKIRARRIAASLFKPKMFKFSSARFKARAEKDCEQAMDAWRRAEKHAAEEQAKYHEAQRERLCCADDISRLRRLSCRATEAKAEANYRKQVADANRKILREPSELTLIFGMNIGRRNHDGVFVYNRGRLIKMYRRCGIQMDGGVLGAGIIGVVDVPYQLLEPAHNKQDFADAREYQQLLRLMGEHLKQYWDDLDLASDTHVGGVVGFWRQYGYFSHKWEDPPAGDENFRMARAQAVMRSLQCDSCLKWRTVPYQAKYDLKDYPDTWVCKDNPDYQFNECTAPERKQVFPEGKLAKQNVTVEKKRELLQERIEEQQKQLKNMKMNLRKRPKGTGNENDENEEESDAEEAGTSAKGCQGGADAKKPRTKVVAALEQAERTTRQVKGDLTALRPDVVVFLRTLNPELNLNPDFETNEVESLLQQFIAGQVNT